MRIRRIAIAALTVALAAALTGCGGDKKSESSSSKPTETEVKVLSKDEVKAALISLDDLGKDFKVDKEADDDDDDDADLGCLNDIDKVLDKETGSGDPIEDAETKAEVEYKADSDIEMPFVMSSTYSLKSEDDITKGFKVFEDAFKDCRTVDTKDKDGTRIQLEIETNKDETDGATNQINLVAAGSFTVQTGGGSIELPFYLGMSMIQVENNIALVGFGSIADQGEGDDACESLNEVGVGRLLAAIKGEPAPESPDLDLHIITERDFLSAMSEGASGAA